MRRAGQRVQQIEERLFWCHYQQLLQTLTDEQLYKLYAALHTDQEGEIPERLTTLLSQQTKWLD